MIMIQVWKRKWELSSGFNKRTSFTEHAYFFIPQLNTYTKGSYYFCQLSNLFLCFLSKLEGVFVNLS